MERSLSCEFPMKTTTFTAKKTCLKFCLQNKQWPVDGYKYTREDHVTKEKSKQTWTSR